MLAITVKFGETVMVGDLAVSVRRIGRDMVDLCISEPSGAARYESVPAHDVIPGVQINAILDDNRARLLVDAPSAIRVSRVSRHNM